MPRRNPLLLWVLLLVVCLTLGPPAAHNAPCVIVAGTFWFVQRAFLTG